MILYSPHYMHSSQNAHIYNKEFSFKTFAKKTQHLQIQKFHAMMQPTQGWMK